MTTTISSRKSPANDLALSFARSHLSEVTGFVHYNFEKNGHPKETIPILENVCYALALFKTRQSECIFEAKELLVKLFAFQTEEGAFSKYLHTYPKPSSYPTLFSILLPLFWIYRDFGHVTEKAFRDALKKAFEKLLHFFQREEHHLLKVRQIQLEVFEAVWNGKSCPEISFEGSIEEELDLFLMLQKVEPKKARPFLDRLSRYYHPRFQQLVLKCRQEEEHYEPSFFDLVFAEITGKFSGALMQSRSLHILGSLIDSQGARVSTEETNCSVFLSGLSLENKYDHHFRYLWKEGESFNSLVCQDRPLTFETNNLDNGFDWVFDYPQEFEQKREGAYELNFYTEFSSDKEFFVEGQKATTFQLGELVTVQTPNRRFSLKFELVEGEGKFFGHLMRGNRPSQTDRDIFQAYDYRICIRTIARSSRLKMRVLVLN